MPGFRAFNGAAPLKRAARAHAGPPSLGFRAFNGAAPLKLGRRLEERRAGNRFPRLQRRGPIEAQMRSTSLLTIIRFRAFNGAAPLKRWTW